jgi:hypothetical protein
MARTRSGVSINGEVAREDDELIDECIDPVSCSEIDAGHSAIGNDII